MENKMKYGSLFSGVGGFDMGFDNAGYDCRWQVEWDKHCQQTLAYHWPDVPKHGDVQDVSGYDLEPVDVIIYGSPCQDLSVAGRRAGIDGTKSSMFFESVRIFKEMRDATAGVFPRVVVWENVPGALNSNKGRDFGAVLAALDDIGAVAQWWNVLDAQYFGVPQRRRRVFLISVFDPAIAGRAGDQQILAVGEGRRRNPQKVKSQGQEVASLTATGVGMCGADDNQAQAGHFIAFHPHYHDGARPQGDVINTVTARWGTGGNNATMIAQHLAFDTQFESNANVFEDQSPTLKASQQSPTVAFPSPPAIAFTTEQTPKYNNDQALTLTQGSPSGGGQPQAVATNFDEYNFTGVLQNAIVRRLTPTECERLMGWPDNHTLHRADGKTNSDSTRYKMCGNGVATPVAQWIAQQLKGIM